ncbi:MAG: ATP synthase F0 subunit C [Armatimonadetes bacterium]|nr:ATP synthase F0 subunit C [Armatimonadota bacterium]
MTLEAALALVVGLGVSIAVLSAALGQGKAAAAALEAIARQPDATGDIQRVMIIALGFIESLVIYALLVFFLLNGKLGALIEVAVSRGGG